MAVVARAAHAHSRLIAVPAIGFRNPHYGKQVVSAVAQRYFAVEWGRIIYRQGYGNGEESAVRKAHIAYDGLKVGLAHEGVERGKPAVGEQFQVEERSV